MSRFKIGQVVKVTTRSKDLGIILTECKEPESHWCVALRTKLGDRTKIVRIAEKELEPYINHCWNCDEPNLNSDIHETCPRCGWIICPACNECKEDGCSSHNLMVFAKPGNWFLLPKTVMYFSYLD